tara:strand:+ start:1022 stop:1915 length:894 start_codon:yes stop_codon:yes gene_type:complete
MTSYNIDQFSKITNIPKLNLRTWENRYSYLVPLRTETNIRVYNDDLLVRGINTKFLLENGHKISKVSKMSDHETQIAIERIGLSENKDIKVSYYLNNFIISAINFDEYKFNRLFIKALNEFDFILFYKVIILPLLKRVGLLWLTNKMSPSQEHFLSELIKQKLYSLIDRTAVSNSVKEKWLLFLPENEFHEIGLLFAKYILSLKEYNVLYLGDNLPIDTLSGVAEKHKVDNILLFLLANYSIKMSENHLQKLNNIFPQSKIYVVTTNKKLNIPEQKKSNIILIHDLDTFIQLLDSSN